MLTAWSDGLKAFFHDPERRTARSVRVSVSRILPVLVPRRPSGVRLRALPGQLGMRRNSPRSNSGRSVSLNRLIQKSGRTNRHISRLVPIWLLAGPLTAIRQGRTTGVMLYPVRCRLIRLLPVRRRKLFPRRSTYALRRWRPLILHHRIAVSRRRPANWSSRRGGIWLSSSKPLLSMAAARNSIVVSRATAASLFRSGAVLIILREQRCFFRLAICSACGGGWCVRLTCRRSCRVCCDARSWA